MAKIVKTFRIEKQLWDEVNKVTQNASRFICLSIVSRLNGLHIPRQEEINRLIDLHTELRRIAVNFNQTARALNFYRSNEELVPPHLIETLNAELEAFHQTRLKIDTLLEVYYGKKEKT